MTDIKRVFGRLESPDARDFDFPVSALIAETPFITEKYWWSDGWWGDQGSTSHCVAYSWSHWIEDGPVIQDGITPNRPKPMLDPARLYKECQLRDPWPGTNYAGTSIRAGAKILKDLNIIKEYRWASSVVDISNALLTVGPVVVGTKWYKNMSRPNSKGYVTPTGTNEGGHAYILNGVNTVKRVFRIKNSWGKDWGVSGFAFITFDDFEKLLKDGGEGCVAIENKLVSIPDWSLMSAPTS